MKWRLGGGFKTELIIFEQYKHWAIKIAFGNKFFSQDKMKIISN
jgi:hypothetical protein